MGDDRPQENVENEGVQPGSQQARGHTTPERTAVMISKGTLLRLVVSLAALASLASLGGGYFDGA